LIARELADLSNIYNSEIQKNTNYIESEISKFILELKSFLID
jgi:hypothetical protein